MSDDPKGGDAAPDHTAEEAVVDVEGEGVTLREEGMIDDSEGADDDSSREDGRERRPWHEVPTRRSPKRAG